MKKSKHIVGGASIAVLLAAGIVGNSLCSIYYSQIQAYMQRFVTSSESANSMTDLSRDDAYTQALQLCEEVESEGLVLLKNDNDTLPLGTDKINLFGYNSYKTVYTDYGSGGHHNEDQNFNFIDGFEFAGLQLNPDLTKFYQTTAQKRASMTGMTVSNADFNIYEETLAEYDEYSATFWQDAKAYSDVAVYVIGRMAGEGNDCPLDMAGYYGGEAGRHYLQLQPAEEELLAKLEATFDKVIIVIDTSNPMDLGFIEDNKVDAAIWAGGPGTTGTIAVAKAMMGEYNPSGHLVDTYAYDVTSSPAYENFGDFTYANSGLTIDGNGDANNGKYMYYQEGIYVGYRYYETRYIGDDNVYTPEEEAEYQKAVQYPFGYGLSYTTFDWSDPQWEVGSQGGQVKVSVKVTNTGNVAGKDVVQLYYTAPYTPGGIEKSAVVLGAFAKTDLLQPGESQTVSMTMNYDDMASYDYKTDKCYVLDAGTYTLSLRSDAHTVKNDLTYDFTVDQTIKYDTTARSTDETVATNQFDDVTAGDGNIGTTLPYLSRADWEGTYPSREASENATANAATIALLTNGNGGSTIDLNDDPAQGTTYTNGEKNGVMLADAAGIVDPDNAVWEQLMNHMSVDEMNNLYGNCGWCSPAVDSIGKPQATECDGPNGIHDLASGLEAAEYATETVLAATWNVDLALKEGEAYGDEDLVNGVSGTYGPGMNIHRSAFGGRAAEYYSEDPLLSGMMAANMVTGLQSRGIYVFAKLFALNDQETNRNGVCIWSNEQAMREIYLRAFEVAIHNVTGDGLNQLGLTGIMESYNRIGTSMVGYSYAMLTQVLRNEWGFQGVVNTDAFAVSNGDLALRAGVDMQLAMGVNVTDTTLKSGYGMQLLRQATKRHLMVLANSSLMTTTRNWTPYWLIALGVVDVILVVAIVLIALHMFKPELFAKKKNKKKAAKA